MGQSDKKFREIFEKSTIGILFYDKEGKLTDANQSALEILGIPLLEDVTGTNLFDDVNIGPKEDELLENGLIKLQYPLNFDNIKKSGIYTPKKSGTAFINLDIFVIESGFLAQIQDITEQKKAKEVENRLKALMDNNPSLIFMKDEEGKYVYLNKSYEKQFVHSTDWYGKTDFDFWPAESAELFRANDDEVLKSGKIHQFMEDSTDLEGTRYVWLNYKFPFTDAKNNKYVGGIGIDTTDRVCAEEALKGSLEENKMLVDLLEASNQPFAIGYVDGSIGYFNKAFENLVGYTKDELKTTTWLQMLTPSKWYELEAEELEKLRRTDKPVRYEKEYIRKDGSIIPVEILAHLRKDDNREILYYYSFITDLTERKKAEEKMKKLLNDAQQLAEELEVSNEELHTTTEELQEQHNELKSSEARFQVLIENLYLGVALVDSDGKFAVVNPAFMRLFGLDGEASILNVNSQDWSLWEVYGEDGKLLHVDEHPVRKAALTSKPVRNKLVNVRNPGSSKLTWMMVSAEPILTKDGSIHMIICTYYDITERKKAEELLEEREWLYRTLFENSGDGFQLDKVLFDENGQAYDWEFLDVNPAFERQTGLKKESVVGKRAKEILPGIESYWVSLLGKVARTGKSEHIENYNKDTDRWYDDYVFKYKEDQVGILFRDISKRKMVEEQLKETITELERSNKELQSFAYITSHDLQEPLRTIGNYAGLLKHRYQGQLDNDADDFLDFMAGGAARMKDMVQGLLDYSRVGTRGEEFKEFNSEDALNQALMNLKSSVEECNAKVTHDKLPVIKADEGQITRIFQNLIGNAFKFRRDGVKAKIHISAEKKDYEYLFSISDNGIGIEEEYCDKIFEVFKRLHAIGKYEGTGIGLAIVKRIIGRHGGRVWVESEYGKGSTFYFTLPLKPVENGGGHFLKSGDTN